MEEPLSTATARAIEANELARRIANSCGEACLVAATLDDAIERAAELTDRDDRVLVAGSFHVVGPALNRLYSRRE